MRQFAISASLIGTTTAVVGFAIAFKYDFPVGPVNVALLGLIYGLVFLARKAWLRKGASSSVSRFVPRG